jgi:hypothetical protein
MAVTDYWNPKDGLGAAVTPPQLKLLQLCGDLRALVLSVGLTA